MRPRVFLALLHYPIYNRNGEVITTCITNLDMHDIARTARTYEVEKAYFVHPFEAQANLARSIIDFWTNDYGSSYNPDRKEAFSILEYVPTLEETITDIEQTTGSKPIVVTTDARIFPNTIAYDELRTQMETNARPYLLLFGTGWGIEKDTMMQFDYILKPILGRGEYNHLPVRSAVAIILDRLLGEHWW